ncbi:DUF1698 domain-containing protein, partial [Gammaproteobacteria bacterium]|nr:DUF1698 domain-containing protein [Gammaproteobacteria bacterium]
MLLDIDGLHAALVSHDLGGWLPQLEQSLDSLPDHGRLGQWRAALDGLPKSASAALSEDHGMVTVGASAERGALQSALEELRPWRKGPFCFGDFPLDAEWRCDRKWQRLARQVDFAGRRVLDIGCGNGYYLLRAHL